MNHWGLSRSATLLTLALLLGTLSSCSEETPIDPPATAPVATFTTGSDYLEGDTIRITNSSSDATAWSWEVTPGGDTSDQENPIFVLEEEGTYTVRLIARGDGGADTVEQTIVVGANSIFRALGHESKTWYLHRVLYDGIDLTLDPCNDDNIMVLNRKESTFFFDDGDNVCEFPSLPDQSGALEFSGNLDSIIFVVLDPIEDRVPYSVEYLTKDSIFIRSFQGSGSFEIAAKTTQRLE